MARIIGKVSPSDKTGEIIRTDSIGRPYLNVQDADTNQFLYVYSLKALNLFAPGGKKISTSKKYSFIGTLHQYPGNNVKMITTKVTVAR